MRPTIIALLTCLCGGFFFQTPTAQAGAGPIYEVTGTYSDPENDVYIELFMEPLEKFLFFANGPDPLSASDPVRIRASAAMVASASTPWKTFDLNVTVIVPPTTQGTWETEIDPTPFGNAGLLLAGEPYIVLAIYSDLVARSPDGILPATTSYFGTHSPGVFIFGPDVALDTPTPTPTATPIGPTPTPLPFGLTVEALVDPMTGRSVNQDLDDNDQVDLEWISAMIMDPKATIQLFFDRDNQLEAQYLDDMNNPVSEVVIGGASRILPVDATLIQEGLFAIDFGPIDLTSDPRFPPPPDTGAIPAFDFNSGIFRWDLSQVPAGIYYVYGVLKSEGQGLVVDYAPFQVVVKDIPRWPILIGDAADDRFVHGVALDDVVQSATELDVVAVAQSGLFRVYDYLGRPWPPYFFDLNVTIDTAPITADVDDDDQIEIILGTNRLNSDQSPVFDGHNSILLIDPDFRGRYANVLADLASTPGLTVEQALLDNDLRQNVHLVPGGHGVFSTPAVRDIDGDGIPEVIYLNQPIDPAATTTLEAINFSPVIGQVPTVKFTVTFTGFGLMGTPSVGNVDSDPALEVVVGSEEGDLFSFDLPDGSGKDHFAKTTVATAGSVIFKATDPGLTQPAILRPPVLVDQDGDGQEEILFAISKRDNRLEDQAQLYFIHGDGSPVFSQARIFEPEREFSSLSTPAVGRLNTDPSSPLVALFTTTNGLYGLDLTNNQPLFSRLFGNQERAFASSSPVIGQTMIQGGVPNQPIEFFIGGGRDQRGNLFGWYFDTDSSSLVQVDGIADFPEPLLPSFERPGAILGSPEMADTNGDHQVEVFYTNADGWVDRFVAPGAATTLAAGVVPSDFPWPAFKHDRQRTGSVSHLPVPVAPFLPGDINRDGVVDERDLFDLSKKWSESVSDGKVSSGFGPQADLKKRVNQNTILRVLRGMKP